MARAAGQGGLTDANLVLSAYLQGKCNLWWIFLVKINLRKAQSPTGIDAGDFSRVRNADFRRISDERLTTMINGLGSYVEVAVTLRRAEARHPAAVA